jgi:ornithine carbamoyltransferase
MRPTITPQCFSAFDTLSSAAVQALLADAGRLQAAPNATLKNRHVAVVCEEPLSAAAETLAAAALAIGAAVVRLQPSGLNLSDRSRRRQTVQLLGRLYGLVCTEGLEPQLNASLTRWAGVPVLSELTAASHPAQVLADVLVMQEHARRPIATLTLGLARDTGAAVQRAWRHASALTGLRICVLDTPPEETATPVCDFYLVCRQQCGESGLPHLLAAASPTGERQCLVAQQLDARHRVLQALMVRVCS